jgi:DNA repair and recombination protein RAD52
MEPCLLDLANSLAIEFDEADFNISEEGHPDYVVLPNSNHTDSAKSDQTVQNGNTSMQPPARQLARAGSTGSINSRQPPQTPNQHSGRPNANALATAQSRVPPGGTRAPPQFNQNRPPGQPNNIKPALQTHMTPPPAGANNAVAPTGGGEVVGFFSARAVNQLPEESLANGQVAPKAGLAFNPRLDSPSIRKTPGIDHTKSKPVARNGQHVPPATTHNAEETSGLGSGSKPGMPPPPLALGGGGGGGGGGTGSGARPAGPPLARANAVVNPALDQTRRIGAPGSSSPLANRGSYRPPTIMKRPAPGAAPATAGTGGGGGGGGDGDGRTPLSDTSTNMPVGNANGNGSGNGNGNETGPEAKRQRVS